MSDTVKVILGDDYYQNEYWADYDPQTSGAHEAYEIHAEQRDRWQAAMDTYGQMQAEIAQLMDARREQRRTGQSGNQTRPDLA